MSITSPCNRTCGLNANKGACLSCKRTLNEIKNWSKLSVCDRSKIMKALQTRDCCPKCGVFNNCAVKQGKSISACWCFSVQLPSNDRVPFGEEGASCLCRKCLTKER